VRYLTTKQTKLGHILNGLGRDLSAAEVPAPGEADESRLARRKAQ
jgi:hypothetical protein